MHNKYFQPYHFQAIRKLSFTDHLKERQCTLSCCFISTKYNEVETELKYFLPVEINKLFAFPQVSVVWPDQHTSVFEPEWLKKRCFSPTARQALQEELSLNGESSCNNLMNTHLTLKAQVCISFNFSR